MEFTHKQGLGLKSWVSGVKSNYERSTVEATQIRLFRAGSGYMGNKIEMNFGLLDLSPVVFNPARSEW